MNERNREELDEVSNKRLTSMAYDIAKGLEYLAEQKYVHRDIACRFVSRPMLTHAFNRIYIILEPLLLFPYYFRYHFETPALLVRLADRRPMPYV